MEEMLKTTDLIHVLVMSDLVYYSFDSQLHCVGNFPIHFVPIVDFFVLFLLIII